MQKQISDFKSIPMLAVLLAMFLFQNCKGAEGDGHELGEDTTPPVLTLISPTDGQNFVNGDTIQIIGKVTDDDSLHEYLWLIRNVREGPVVHEAIVGIHNQAEYDIHEISIVHGVLTALDWTVTVHVEDHSGNLAEESVTINVDQ